jgi:hypothetical protein
MRTHRRPARPEEPAPAAEEPAPPAPAADDAPEEEPAPPAPAAVAPPVLRDAATPPFFVADVAAAGAAFLAELEAATAGVDASLVDAAGLRLLSEAEELVAIAAAAGAPGTAPAAAAAAPEAAALAAAIAAAAAALPADQAEKLAAQLEFDARALAARARRAAERADAERALHALRAVRRADEAAAAAAADAAAAAAQAKAAAAAAGLAAAPAGRARGYRPWRTTSGLGAPVEPTLAGEARARQLARTAAAAPAGRGAPLEARVPPGEPLLHLAIFLPGTSGHVSEEWLALGRTPLAALLDAAGCLAAANVAAVEREEAARRGDAPGAPPAPLARPGAYLYFEGVFYNDTRAPGAADLSAAPRAAARAAGRRAPPHPPPGARGAAHVADFSVGPPAELATFGELWLRLGAGAPGLLCHAGGCEHAVVVRDARAHDPAADPPLLAQYPFRLAAPGEALAARRGCEACRGRRSARRVTYGDAAAPTSPFFWCDECFTAAHYDAEGRALDTAFRVFPYTGEFSAAVLAGGNTGRRAVQAGS